MRSARRHMRHVARPQGLARAAFDRRPARLSWRHRSRTGDHPARLERRCARQHNKQIRESAHAPPPRRSGCETKAWQSAADTPSASPRPSRRLAWPACADKPRAPARPQATSDPQDSSARAASARFPPVQHLSKSLFLNLSFCFPFLPPRAQSAPGLDSETRETAILQARCGSELTAPLIFAPA